MGKFGKVYFYLFQIFIRYLVNLKLLHGTSKEQPNDLLQITRNLIVI